MTRRRVVTTRRADEDIDDAVTYYLSEGAADVALRFVESLEEVRDLVAEHPSIGSPRFAIDTGIAELRAISLPSFPYVAIYTDEPDAVRIHRVLHTSRDIPAELSDEGH